MKDSNLKSLEVKRSNELTNIYEWMNANKLTINTAKSQTLVIPFKSKPKNVNINIPFNQAQLQLLLKLKYLGIYLDKDLNFSKHLNYCILNQKLFVPLVFSTSVNLIFLVKFFEYYIILCFTHILNTELLRGVSHTNLT